LFLPFIPAILLVSLLENPSGVWEYFTTMATNLFQGLFDVSGWQWYFQGFQDLFAEIFADFSAIF